MNKNHVIILDPVNKILNLSKNNILVTRLGGRAHGTVEPMGWLRFMAIRALSVILELNPDVWW